MRYFLTFKGF